MTKFKLLPCINSVLSTAINLFMQNPLAESCHELAKIRYGNNKSYAVLSFKA